MMIIDNFFFIYKEREKFINPAFYLCKMAITDIIQANPKISIIIISGFVSLFISLVNYFVLDKDKVKAGKEKQKKLQAEIKLHKDNPQKMMELNKEMMGHVGENFKHSFRPMLITLIPILVVFAWIRNVFTDVLSGWIWWYLVSAIIFSMVFRKVFKLP